MYCIIREFYSIWLMVMNNDRREHEYGTTQKIKFHHHK